MERWIRARYIPSIPLGKNGERVTASQEHILLSKNAAKEGMVLLKNRDGRLPLASGSRLALFGKGCVDYVKGGGGSGDVTVPYIVNLVDGFRGLDDSVTLFDDTVEFYEKAVQAAYRDGQAPGLIEEPELPETLVKKARAFTDNAIVTISRFSGEGWDRKSDMDKIEKHEGILRQTPAEQSGRLFPRGDFELSDREEAMLALVERYFDRIIVVLNVGSMVNVARYEEDEHVAAVFLAWQAGLEGGRAAAELLMGIGCPSGRLADTFAHSLKDYPGSATFYDSDSYAEYEEDIYVGYRYFETIPGAKDKVVYPFGYGLSYTDFTMEEVASRAEGDTLTVSVLVRNVGPVAGKEVVQLYVSAPQGLLGKPAKELCAFRKTRLLAPGEEEIVTLRCDIREMASYDDLGKVQECAYVLEKGEYRFFCGANVRDAVPVSAVITLQENEIVAQLSHRMAPYQLKRRMLADGSYESLPQREPNDPNATVLMRPETKDIDGVQPATRAVPRIPRRTKIGPMLQDVADGEMTLQEFIATLSDDDLIHLVGGQPNTGVANTFGIGNDPVHGIPNIMTADGPAGLRVWSETGIRTTAFPCACLLSCTWDPDIVYAVGRAGGEEVKENNIFMWLTPAVNIHRSPLCGRNFEYYSEDPMLTAVLGGAMVRGIQSTRVSACIKHFAANNKETNRKDSDSRVSERALREIYLKAFRLIMRDANPWAVMTSYNIINSHRASENADLLIGMLRDEWGYDGVVTTDWWTHAEHYKEVMAGNDLKMPTGFPERLKDALDKGVLTRAALEKAVEHILTFILRVD